MGLLATSRPFGQPPAGPGSGETVVNALRDLGYVEGRNIVIERRYSEGIRERLPGLAAELVAFKPDDIFTHGTLQTMAVYRATRTIPIVAFSGDLVEQGLVSSLARPGGNVAGLQAMQPEVAGKRLALLKDPRAIALPERGLQICTERQFHIIYYPIAAYLGLAYALAGRDDEAQSLLERSVAIDAGLHPVLRVTLLGEAHLLAGRLVEAQRYVERALALAEVTEERVTKGGPFGCSVRSPRAVIRPTSTRPKPAIATPWRSPMS